MQDLQGRECPPEDCGYPKSKVVFSLIADRTRLRFGAQANLTATKSRSQTSRNAGVGGAFAFGDVQALPQFS
jgi:hypothetical protein